VKIYGIVLLKFLTIGKKEKQTLINALFCLKIKICVKRSRN